MKYLYFFIIFLLSTSIAFSQYGWFKQEYPGTAQFVDISFVDTQHGWAAGMNSLYKTTNGGKNWTKIQTQLSNIQSIYFYDENYGYAMVSAGISGNFLITINKTSDGGVTWQQATYDPGMSGFGFWVMTFKDQNFGWMTGGGSQGFITDGVVAVTQDAGNSWRTAILDTIGYISSGYFPDNNNGWVASVDGFIFKTNNGGHTWSKQFEEPDGSAFWSVFFTSSTEGWAGSTNGVLYHTGNGGASWEKSYLGSGIKSTISDLYFADNNTGWAATTSGIYITKDGGNSWDKQELEDGSADITDFSFVDRKNAWSISKNMIYNTDSGGEITTRINAKIQAEGNPVICHGDSLLLMAEPNISGYTYKWSTGETGRIIYVHETGEYTVIVESTDGNKDSASIQVTVMPELTVTIDGETAICKGENTTLSVNEDYLAYEWSTGESGREITINEIGSYWIEVFDDNGCSNKFTFEVVDKGVSNLFRDISKIIVDTTALNTTYDTAIVIENKTGYDYSLTSLEIKYNSSIFNVKLKEGNLPLLIENNENIELSVSFTPVEDRTYIDSLIIESDEPCQSEKRIQIMATGKISTFVENDRSEKLIIAPNPVYDYLQIINPSLAPGRIMIFTLEGKNIYKSEYKEKINVSGLSRGVYFLRIGDHIFRFVKM